MGILLACYSAQATPSLEGENVEMAPFEILEHTADVGVRASGVTLEETFEQAARGMCEIAGIWREQEGKDGAQGGEEVEISLRADDLGALLIDWLSEILYLYDSRRCAVAGVRADRIALPEAKGSVRLLPLGDELAEGVQVKAITYHRLRVERSEEGWMAEVYLDI
jgi:SHS2 domain-containing protein